jgi:hypothetical protein
MNWLQSKKKPLPPPPTQHGTTHSTIKHTTKPTSGKPLPKLPATQIFRPLVLSGQLSSRINILRTSVEPCSIAMMTDLHCEYPIKPQKQFPLLETETNIQVVGCNNHSTSMMSRNLIQDTTLPAVDMFNHKHYNGQTQFYFLS